MRPSRLPALQVVEVIASPPKACRIVPIDATRGLVMLFSCLAHFAWWIHPTYPELGDALGAIGMIATPTFLLLSGAMTALLYARGRSGTHDPRSQLFNRGLFLLTVGHFLIAMAEAHEGGGLLRKLAATSVVDEIGLCMLLSTLFVRYISDPVACRRAAFGAGALFLFASLAVALWHPDNSMLLALRQLVLGGSVSGNSVGTHVAPTLQYIAIYTMGLPIGHALVNHTEGNEPRVPITKKFFTIGLALVATGSFLRIARNWAPEGFHHMLTITAKLPPSPAYLSFFAGCGLLSAAATFWSWESATRLGRPIVRWIAPIGRASLFVFILQYFLYWTLPDLLGIKPNAQCGLLFIGNVLAIRYSAGLWSRVNGNRWITLGIHLPRHS